MRVEPGLTSHPKFIRLKKRVGDIAAEVLIRLWGHCQDSQRGEYWPRADADYLEVVCGWDGQPGLLWRALLDAHWILQDAGGVRVHDWNAMNPSFLANWRNGPKGGRPPKDYDRSTGTKRKPVGNPLVNQSETSGLPPANQVDITKQNSTELPEGGPGESPSRTGQSGLRYDFAQQLVEFLNQASGGSFLATSAILHEVAHRLAETQQDLPGVKQMITRQAALWGRDEKMRPFLRPATLFDEKKFHDYYGQRSLPLPNKNGDPLARRRELEEQIEKSPANRQSRYHDPLAGAAEKEKLRAMRKELAQV